MLDVLTLYWDPAGPHYIYGRTLSELEGMPDARDDGLEQVMLTVPTTFVAMWVPKGEAADAVWQAVPQATATFQDHDPMGAFWFQGPGLYRVQADGQTLFVHLVATPGKWSLLKVDDEEAGRARVPDGILAVGQSFVEVTSVMDLVP